MQDSTLQAPAESEPRRGLPAKRRAIMDAAARVFIREGYERASVDAIAAEAAVSKRTIYNHFTGKHELFVSVIGATLDAVAAEARAALDESLAESDDVERDLVAFARRFVPIFLREDAAALRRLVMAEAARHPELLRTWTGAGQARGIAELTRVLARLDERGKLEVPDPARAARQLTMLLTIEPWQVSRFGTVPLRDAEIDEIIVPNIELFVRGYAPRRRRAGTR